MNTPSRLLRIAGWPYWLMVGAASNLYLMPFHLGLALWLVCFILSSAGSVLMFLVHYHEAERNRRVRMLVADESRKLAFLARFRGEEAQP